MTIPQPASTHEERLQRALLSLEGLSVGDAFGGKFFTPPGPERAVPPPVWRYSDDTEMAIAIVQVLGRHYGIDQADLAGSFARRYQADPYRGYGLSVRRVLEAITGGDPWDASARSIYGGTGSMGNGGAMRVAPLGAYFADDIGAVVKQARASAEVPTLITKDKPVPLRPPLPRLGPGTRAASRRPGRAARCSNL